MNIEQLLQSAAASLENSDSPKLDAECLLSFVLDQNRTYLYTWPDKTLSETQQLAFNALVKQRQTGHPIAHLIGTKEFWGLELQVTPDTLIPRPDTELLVEKTLEKALKITPPLSILDLGTGTGAIACAIKHELPSAEVVAVDFSEKALKVANSNADAHQLKIQFIQSDWFSNLSSEIKFDFILSNPPYIEDQDPHLSQGDVRFDPISALTSGKDGLNDIRNIIQSAKPFLKKNGWVIIEHGYNQAQQVASIFENHQYQAIQTYQDLGQQPRITMASIREE